jgi:hypothetical protein
LIAESGFCYQGKNTGGAKPFAPIGEDEVVRTGSVVANAGWA